MTEDNLKEIKKEIAKDWQLRLPDLVQYSQNKIYKIIGPIAVGIELIKLPFSEEYRPHFTVYPLWKESVKECMDTPIVLQEFKNNRGFQINIPYLKHKIFFSEVIENVKTQIPLPLDRDLYLKELFSFMDSYVSTSPMAAATNSYLQAKQKEYKLHMALYVNNNNEIENIFNQIKNNNWDVGNFKMFNIEIGEWVNSLREKLSDREKIIATIDVNLMDKRLRKLPISLLKA